MTLERAIRKACITIALRCPAREITDPGSPPYLRRFFLMKLGPLQMYLHQFVGSEPDHGLHDHPWDWAGTVLLAGCYLEEQDDDWVARVPELREAPSMRILRGRTYHRILMMPGQRMAGGTWTLFWHLGRTKKWGFKRRNLANRQLVSYEHGPELYHREGHAPLDGRWWRSSVTGAVLFPELVEQLKELRAAGEKKRRARP